MTNTNRAFTLIELLVVVLILGILAAVALPQYQFAVEKSRVTEAITVLNAFTKGIDLYVLEHGYEDVYFTGDDAVNVQDLGIDIKSQLSCSRFDYHCNSEHFAFDALCVPNDQCAIGALRIPSDAPNWLPGDDNPYSLVATKMASTNQWKHSCRSHNAIGQKICASLAAQGWTN